VVDRILRWLDERIPAADLVRRALDEEIPGGSRYAYTLGSATLFVFLVQAITGVWQLFYYVPTVDHAYDSVSYLRTGVPFGWLVHNLHYWGANAMIVLVGLHIARVFLFGAYKRPREATWLAGVVLLLVTAGMVFTGAPLPWDERGYWAAEVGTSIAGTVPFVGDAAKRLLRGGSAMGPLALSRMFVLHVAILPAMLMGFVAVHLLAFRKVGSVGPWDEAKRTRTGPFWPDQAFKDTVVATALLVLLVGLCVFAPPPVAGPADPLDSSYIPKPEWNFLFLYEALKFLPGRLEPLGTVGIPLLGVLILVLLPFFDRNPEAGPRRRPLAMAGGVIWVGFVVSFTIIGYYSHPEGAGGAAGQAPAGSTANLSESARQGSRLVASLGCDGCHSIDGRGGSVGPDLSDEATRGRSRKWLATQIKDPKAHNPDTIMPSFGTLSDRQLNDLLDYLMSLGASPAASSPVTSGGSPPGETRPGPTVRRAARPAGRPAGTGPPGPTRAGQPVHGAGPLELGPPGPAASIIGSVGHGKTLFGLYCAECHGAQGKGGVANPGSTSGTVPALNPISRKFFDPDPETFATNIDRVLQRGAIPQGPFPAKRMLVFGRTKSLSQEQIADVEAYVLSLNGVDRAQLKNPGIRPHVYFALMVGVFLLAAAGLWAYRMRRPG